jgi:dihydropteroate synthase
MSNTINKSFQSSTTINCNGHLLHTQKPLIMGILNITNDSFYSGSKYSEEKDVLKAVESMLVNGVSIIDIGGMSSRPGARMVDPTTELSHILPVIKSIKKHFPDVVLSVDTVYGETAKSAFGEGASIINDISAGSVDPSILDVAAKYHIPYILMHMQGRPDNMQLNPEYDDVVQDVFDFLMHKISRLRKKGIYDIIIDPGFGFGKTVEQNYELLSQLGYFKQFGYPVLAGISRKSMICKPLRTNPEDALNGTTALHVIALQNGADILRVHDVREAQEVVKLFYYLFD